MIIGLVKRQYSRPFVFLSALLLASSAIVVLPSDVNGQPDVQIPAAAWIDDLPIGQEVVEAQVDQILKEREVGRDQRDLLRAQALNQIISQHLIVGFLERNEIGASSQDIDLAIARLTERLERQSQTLDSYLEARKMTRERFEWTLAWQIGWRSYLDEYLTDQNLEQFFEERKREFDGTELETFHILYRVDDKSDEQAWQNAIERAQSARRELEAGELTFADAAKAYSDSLTGNNAGAVGWIERDGGMPEPFLRALFDLPRGEVSQPIRSSYGIHLIRWTDMRPGTKTWREAGDRLQTAARLYLFEWVADKQREFVTIRYAPQFPHFDPASGELIRAK